MDARGVPLSLLVTGANRHDVTQLPAVLDGNAVARPAPTAEAPHHLCADAGYVGEPARQAIVDRGYLPHVRQRGERDPLVIRDADHQPRRWVVEAAHSWFNRFRKLLVRYEKTHSSYLALGQLAAAIICWRKVAPIYG